MTKNPNEIPNYSPTPEQLEAIFAQTAQHQIDAQERERRAREWPHHIEKLLTTLVDHVAMLEARVGKMETGSD